MGDIERRALERAAAEELVYTWLVNDWIHSQYHEGIRGLYSHTSVAVSRRLSRKKFWSPLVLEDEPAPLRQGTFVGAIRASDGSGPFRGIPGKVAQQNDFHTLRLSPTGAFGQPFSDPLSMARITMDQVIYEALLIGACTHVLPLEHAGESLWHGMVQANKWLMKKLEEHADEYARLLIPTKAGSVGPRTLRDIFG